MEIDFPPNIKNLYKAIAKRHDIVHRSGRTKDVKQIIISRNEIVELMQDVRTFADYIDSAWGV